MEGSGAVQLDHLILPVNDLDASVAFYSDVLGFASEGSSGPFTILRVSPDLTLQLAPWGTAGGMHLAFAMPAAEFERRFARIQEADIPYGDSFHSVGNQQGPGREDGAHGLGASLYVLDPSEHLVELRYYD